MDSTVSTDAESHPSSSDETSALLPQRSDDVPNVVVGDAAAAADDKVEARRVRFNDNPVTTLFTQLSGLVQGGHQDDNASADAANANDDAFFVDARLEEDLARSSNNHSSANTESSKAAAQQSRKFGGSTVLWRRIRSISMYSRTSTTMHLKKTIRLPIRYRKEVATILVLIAVATEFIGISISSPVLVQYAASFGVGEQFTGLVFSVTGLSNFLANLWIPIRSDRFGRKHVIVFTLVGSLIAYVIEASATSFDMLLFGLFMGGLFGGTQPVAVAYISDIYDVAQRPRFIGMVPACASVCFTLGPALGGLWANLTDSFRAPIIFAAFVVAAMLPIIVWFLPDSKDLVSQAEREEIKNVEKAASGRGADLLRSTYFGIAPAVDTSPLKLSRVTELVESSITYAGPLRDIRCYLCLLTELGRSIAFSTFVTCIPLVLTDPVFGMKNKQEAVMYAGMVIGVGSAFKSIGLFICFDRIQKRIGLVETIVLGTVLSIIAFTVLSFMRTTTGMAVGFSIFAFGSSMIQPGVFAHVTSLVPKEYTARAVAMPNVATSLGQTLGPVASTSLLSMSNYFILFQAVSLMSFIQLIVTMPFFRNRSKKKDFDESALSEEEEEDDTLPMAEFQMLLSEHLLKVLNRRHYKLCNRKSQIVILEMVNRTFPYLREDDESNEADLDKLMRELSISKHAKRKQRRERNVDFQDSLVPRSCSITGGSW